MKRSEFKAVVKECLLEILMEGVAAQSNETVQSEQRRYQQPVQKSATRKSPLDYVIPNQPPQQKREVQESKDRNVEAAKKLMHDDPVMSSIFADTASTTLREQIAAESGKRSHADTGVDPMSLFENAGNWAALAFSENPAKRS